MSKASGSTRQSGGGVTDIMVYYDSYVDSYANSQRVQINALTSDATQQIKRIQQRINEFKSNPQKGTRKAFVQEAKKFAKMGYNKNNIEDANGIANKIASHASDAAFRKALPTIEKKLKQLKQ